MKAPSDRFTAFATGFGGFGYIVYGVAAQSVTVMVLALAVAVFMLVTCGAKVREIRRDRKPAVPARDPRKLASTAQDEAAKAADLGLPTGVWTDLAAAWTTWADTADADKPVKAPETPAERRTLPSGPSGSPVTPRATPSRHARAGIPRPASQARALRKSTDITSYRPQQYANLLRVILADVDKKVARNKLPKGATAIIFGDGSYRIDVDHSVHAIKNLNVATSVVTAEATWTSYKRTGMLMYSASCNHCGGFFEDTDIEKLQRSMKRLHGNCGEPSVLTEPATLPQVKATNPPSGYLEIVGQSQGVVVPPTSSFQRTHLIVWRTNGELSLAHLLPNCPPGFTAADFDGEGEPIARVVMPPNTSTVAPCQITDLRRGETVEIRNGSGDVIRRYRP